MIELIANFIPVSGVADVVASYCLVFLYSSHTEQMEQRTLNTALFCVDNAYCCVLLYLSYFTGTYQFYGIAITCAWSFVAFYVSYILMPVCFCVHSNLFIQHLSSLYDVPAMFEFISSRKNMILTFAGFFQFLFIVSVCFFRCRSRRMIEWNGSVKYHRICRVSMLVCVWCIEFHVRASYSSIPTFCAFISTLLSFLFSRVNRACSVITAPVSGSL